MDKADGPMMIFNPVFNRYALSKRHFDRLMSIEHVLAAGQASVALEEKATSGGSEADILSFVQRKADADLLRLSEPFARGSLSASLATTLAGLRDQASSPYSSTHEGTPHPLAYRRMPPTPNVF